MRGAQLMALTKFCNASGCKNLIPITDQYCADHLYLTTDRGANRHAQYDDKIRHGKDAQLTAFYHSPAWRMKRTYIIAKYHGIDVYAYYVHHQIIPATLPHHIVELREDWSLRLADDNLIPVSAASHSEIGKMYSKDKASAQAMLKGLLAKWEREHPAGGVKKF